MSGQAEMTIKLRVHFSGPDAEERVETVKRSGMMVAKQWLTFALLVSDKRKPQILMEGGDWVTEQHEIEILDDIDGETSGEATADQADSGPTPEVE